MDSNIYFYNKTNNRQGENFEINGDKSIPMLVGNLMDGFTEQQIKWVAKSMNEKQLEMTAKIFRRQVLENKKAEQASDKANEQTNERSHEQANANVKNSFDRNDETAKAYIKEFMIGKFPEINRITPAKERRNMMNAFIDKYCDIIKFDKDDEVIENEQLINAIKEYFGIN